jgi:hypothetical protein
MVNGGFIVEIGNRIAKIKIFNNSLRDHDSRRLCFPMFFDKVIKLEVFNSNGEIEKRARLIIVPKYNHKVEIEIIVIGVTYFFVNKEIIYSDNISFEGRLDIVKTENNLYIYEYGADIFSFTAKDVIINEAKYIDSL